MQMARYFSKLNYDGSEFCGWQIQPHSPSVQEELNKALSTLLREKISVVGCGRTDTGVHAKNFVLHFDCKEISMPLDKLTYKLNGILGNNISIHEIFRVKDDSHARFDAQSREYKYYIDLKKDPFTHKYAYHPNFIPDIKLMNKACGILFEYIDFTSFSKLHTDAKTNNCIIYDAHWLDHGEQYVFTICADRFLRNMVRAIVGTMLDVGRGRISLDEFREIIEKKDRCKAGVSVPGKALFLNNIEYDFEKLIYEEN
jgi:tRNA pseudouridine38-40 synthase